MGQKVDLAHQDAITKIKELAEDIGVCMFCTELNVQPIATRPMAIQEVDEAGNLWFISSKKSNKNFAIMKDNRVQLLFSKTSDSHYLSVYGVATIYKDRATIEDVWSPIAKAWFEQGKDDPDATVIRVSPSDAYYWDTKDGKIISLIKIVASTVTGIHADGGVEGRMNI